jgi:hypothetical protein
MKPFTSKHCAQYLTKESPLYQNQTKELTDKPKVKTTPEPNKKLKEKVETARRAAFIRSKSEYEEYEESPEEIRAQRKYDRLKKRLDRKEQK